VIYFYFLIHMFVTNVVYWECRPCLRSRRSSAVDELSPPHLVKGPVDGSRTTQQYPTPHESNASSPLLGTWASASTCASQQVPTPAATPLHQAIDNDSVERKRTTRVNVIRRPGCSEQGCRANEDKEAEPSSMCFAFAVRCIAASARGQV